MPRINGVIFLTAISFSTTVSADPYLEALEAESSHSSIDAATIHTPKTLESYTGDTDKLPARMREVKFSAFLMNNYYETFVQLNELDFLDRQNVYLQYLEMESPVIDDISALISTTKP